MNTDKIEKRTVLKAPIGRVWRAISRPQEFGAWFRVALEGEFVEGTPIRGRITYPGYEHLTAELFIETIRAPTYFAFRWHPHATEPNTDYSDEPTTLVEFELEEVAGGTQLTVHESGFDRIPEARRSLALRMNDQGWASQLQNVEEYVARN
ncbi:MAG TPA: SRPBCC family protein [Polyangiaceae bacterium]|nr:SRPBCC family protein [Polyangiaceae bacterium]